MSKETNSLHWNLFPLAALAHEEYPHFSGIRVPVADYPQPFAIAPATLHLKALQKALCALW